MFIATIAWVLALFQTSLFAAQLNCEICRIVLKHCDIQEPPLVSLCPRHAPETRRGQPASRGHPRRGPPLRAGVLRVPRPGAARPPARHLGLPASRGPGPHIPAGLATGGPLQVACYLVLRNRGVTMMWCSQHHLSTAMCCSLPSCPHPAPDPSS